MLTLFKKLFGKAPPQVAAPAPVVPLAPSAPMPSIEVAHLSLAAIASRFPDDLKPLLAREPDEAATVALPVPTILKQLPAGCVKMSLASLQRQAHGLITPLPPGDKRMVDVPLAEIFRHIRLSTLKRRPDQRPVFIPDTGYNLFGDASNPYAISPDDHLEQVQVLDLTANVAKPEVAPPPAAPRILKMDDGLREHFASTAAAPSITPADSSAASKFELSGSGPRMSAPHAEFSAPKIPAPVPIAKPQGSTLDLALALLSGGWPDEIREEVAALDAPAVVTLPLEDVSSALSKGRVTFSWGQIRAWSEPSFTAPTSIAENTVLSLPLKVVAPAFLLASKKPKAERRSLEVDESIPALFSDGREPETKVEPEASAPDVSAGPVGPAETPATGGAEPAGAATPEPQRIPETVGEVFGQPQKKDWTPAEMVAGMAKLPGVAGAIVALQEGLQVASILPDGVKSEVVAAFLPQIFARLNQYSGEMKLGEVDDLLFTTHGAHCQIYRLGYVYLAVLGKPGESLPWHELRLISEELARQTHL